MTPNQLPPPPEPDTHCFDDDTGKDVWSYSADQMHAYALAALAQQAQEPVYWEWRHLGSNQHAADFGQWSQWQKVEARSLLSTVEDELRSFRRYIADGYKYELRALYATPPAPQPAPVDEREAWLPIESAPKDGTPILAAQAGLHPETGEPFVPCSVILDGDKVQVFCDSDADEWVSLSDWRLTHWQPLPPAPQTKGQP